jgi:predicted membrane protein
MKRHRIQMLDNSIELRVESDSSNEDFRLRISWLRTLRVRIDDCEDDSIRDRNAVQKWMIDLSVVIQN